MVVAPISGAASSLNFFSRLFLPTHESTQRISICRDFGVLVLIELEEVYVSSRMSRGRKLEGAVQSSFLRDAQCVPPQ